MKVAFTLKQASEEDFNALRTEGCLYFLKSVLTGKFDPYPRYVHDNMDKVEFRQLYRQGSVYVTTNFEQIDNN
ncbi:hypothetical protein [Paenimyroides baculatum]|uniref:Uncharacterized protein n=1 Tax=Paenimyroides baculatum TaxID=2608000 RepID=A0A5M6CCB1_9FLAO|nr:hypothetical protein [Paenimyroides baculatum]KAA5532784.1 hypothetical protein F0460_13140 [Paenimyroides baculatum]